MKIFQSVFQGACILATAMFVASPAVQASEFYKGKTLSFLVNYGAGGNTGIQAQLLMKHMKNHIAGNPNVIPKFKPGAGGIVATNYLATAVENDGLTMGIFSAAFLSEIMGDKALTVTHKDFIVVGGIPEDMIIHGRVSDNLSMAGDLVGGKAELKSAGYRPTSAVDLMLRSSLDLLDANYRHVSGFKSSGKIRDSILKGNVDIATDSMTGYSSRIKPNFISTGRSIPLYSLGIPGAGNSMVRAPGSPTDIPTFYEFYKVKFGKAPSGEKYEIFKLLGEIYGASLRVVFLPKDSPKEAVDALRKAFADTIEDPAYQADFKKVSGFDLVALTGAVAQEKVSRLLSVDPATVASLKKFVNSASN